jgi:hypothetical protein
VEISNASVVTESQFGKAAKSITPAFRRLSQSGNPFQQSRAIL